MRGTIAKGCAPLTIWALVASGCPPEPASRTNFHALTDVCLNSAGGGESVSLAFEDATNPAARFGMLFDLGRPVPPPDKVAFDTGGTLDLRANGPADVGDYSFMLVSETGDTDPLYVKVVHDEDPFVPPAASRPFRLALVPSVGRHWYAYGDPLSPHVMPPWLTSFSRSIGSADLILLQVLPEWNEGPYDQLDTFLVPKTAEIRARGRDVIVALGTFGSKVRDKVAGHHLEDLAEPCGGNLKFSCATLRERFAAYAEAVAREIRPPYLILAVEADLYRFWNSGAEYQTHFAAAFKEAARRVKAVSPSTQVGISVQYDGGVLMLASLLSLVLPGVSAEEAIRDELAGIFTPLAPECDLLGITTFPELTRNFRVAMDDVTRPHTQLPVTPFYDPADIPLDYYRHVVDLVGTPGFPPKIAVTESGWSTLDVDTFTCEDYAHYPLSVADTLIFRDGVTDPAVTHRTYEGQRRALRRMATLMFEQVRPEFWVWFYSNDPSGGDADLGGAPPIFPIFQSMGFHEDAWTFDGACNASNPDSPENAARVRIVGEASKTAYCDWLRLFALPYAPEG